MYKKNNHSKYDLYEYEEDFVDKKISSIFNKINSKYPKIFMLFCIIFIILVTIYFRGGNLINDSKGTYTIKGMIFKKHYKPKYNNGYRIQCSVVCPQSYKEAKERIISICKYYALILLFFYKEIRNFFLYKIYYPDRGIKPKNKKISGKIDTKNLKF